MALPNTYKQVEYIESSGTQYIDTGYIPSNNTKVELKMSGWSHIGTYSNLFGARKSWGSSGRGFLLGYNYNQSTYFGMFGQWYDVDHNGWSGTTLNFKDGNTYTIEMSKSGVYQNGTLKSSFTSMTFTSPVNMSIFGDNNNGTTNEKSAYKLYYFKIRDNGTLIRDLVPCYRKSDNKPGLYDLVNDVFYTNQGTGEFSYPAQNGKITHIYVGTQQVRPSWWKPTNNTIVYYEFNNNLNDSINNAHPLSLTQGATKYGDIGIRKYFEFNGNTYLSATPMIPSAGPFTISCRCLWSAKNITNNVGQAYYQQAYLVTGSQDVTGTAISMYERTGTLRSRGKGVGDLDTGYSLNINTWYNIIFTYTSGSLKIYVNGSLIYTQSRTINTRTPDYFWVGRRGEYASGTAGSNVLVANGGKVSELFAENKTWTATEVSDYYNLTKSNYGL